MTTIANKPIKEYYDYIYSFHQEMLENKFCLVYEGEITHQITKAFASFAESNMEKEMADINLKKRVFHIIIEALQNICKHSVDEEYTEPFIKNGIFIIGKYEDEYHIITGNKISNTKIKWMQTLLEKINVQDKKGINELYKKTLKEGKLSDKSGAGLGLIDIARKSGNPLEFYFEKIDNNLSFFILKIKIPKTYG